MEIYGLVHASSVVDVVLMGLICIADYGLTLQSGGELNLEGYVDADWARIFHPRSTGGYCLYLGSNLVQWSSKKHVVVLSSTEAEYLALAQASTEVAWM
ncbi:secreted RxLR effector protein 161-like [Pistacia vera]|uniref:secreted RxLR effector protein 161-like n=1 Tax=Pistacia vera TaxID=55513 RepID=UPI001263B936|nr:secreted RxLR effector protein 161-like [Pistacia vera]